MYGRLRPLLLAALCAHPLRAQPREVEPPALQEWSAAEYPFQGLFRGIEADIPCELSIDARGAVTARYTGPGDLAGLTNQPDWDATQLGKTSGEIDAGLVAARAGLAQAVLAGLSGLLGAKSDLTRVATAHLAPEMDAVTFFNKMLSIQNALPIPSDVTAYLFG